MKITKNILSISLLVLLMSPTHVKKSHLLSCWNKQVGPLKNQFFTFRYTETKNELEHSFEPWQQTNYSGNGTIWTNGNNFFKEDTIINSTNKRSFFSKKEFTKSDLLFLDYGDKSLFPVTKDMFLDEIFNSARYSPVTLINYFSEQSVPLDKESNQEFAVYKTLINKSVVTLYIRKTDNLVDRVTILTDDELFGDVLSTFAYRDYVQLGKLFYPGNVQIEKINGKIKDDVKVNLASFVNEAPNLLDRPVDYQLKEIIETKPEISVTRYSEKIYFIELKHTDDRIMVVEFAEFLLVAEAPLESKNGELIISEAKKIAPNKPIKYFVFGHFHPHYLGGLRPFVHKGSKILCSNVNKEYVEYLVNAPHTITPDSLQNEPKKLYTEEIEDSLTISDNKFDMKIYFIGKKSEHTNDYLIYYFPAEKLLFEDDLVWIPKAGDPRKASKRQAGLYSAIQELHLDVKTIVQSWPVKDYGVKTIIPFEELEASMQVQ